MTYVKKDALLLCTGCPGVPARLETKEARTVKLDKGVVGVSTDKKIAEPAFGGCLAVPTAPRKCNPKLGSWANVKSDVKSKGESQLLFPNTIPCTFGPGVISMTYAGQMVSRAGATQGKVNDKPCKWKVCKEKHKIKYRDDGIVTRRALGEWIKPYMIYDKVYRIAPMGRSKRRAENYATRKHHVIPVKVFKGLPNIKRNLKLLGYDINNEILNGMTLSFYTADLVWHDLQFHRGSHPKYDNKVKDELKGIEDKCSTYCKDEIQMTLWTEIDKSVKDFREKILNWKWLLHGNSKIQREKEFINRSDVQKNVPTERRDYFF